MTGTSRISRWQSIVVAFSMVTAVVVITPHEPARAATLSVPSEFATIQAAIGVAQPGDVIEVAPGTYVEPPIAFSQSITIVGTGTRAEQVVVTSNTTGTAMLTVPSGVSVSIQNLELSGTSGGAVGGAVLNSGNIDLVGVVISGNSATTNGGAISNQSGTARLISSLVANNTAPTHGGLHNFGTLVISNTTITGNSSPTGSVILNGGFGTVQINNSTIVGNSGVALSGVAGISVSNSILAGNSINDCGAGVSAGHNIIQNNVGCSTDVTDLLGIDPDLGLLSDNGGTTDSFLPNLASPAIDAGASIGAPPGCFTTDQRGVSRPQGDACDIGSVEVEQVAPPATPLQDLIDASIASGGNETIIVPPGVYNESITISSDITLVGGGATAGDTVIDASGLGTPTVSVGGNAAFENLTITGGTSGTQGGNVINDSADLTLTNVIVSNGTAQSGANIAAGGGATVTIVDSTISGGQASNGGGGISIASGSDLQVIGSVISGNSAAFGNGGGIAASGSTVTIDGSTLINNSAGSGAGRGGAVYADENSSVDIVDSTIENNTAGLGGGAYAAGPMVVAQSLFNSNAATFPDGSTGGGIGGTGTISVANSTFQANTSAGNGGGVGIISGVTTLNNVTLTENVATVAGGALSGDPGATIRVGNSLSAGNGGSGPDCANFIFESLGHNVLEGAPPGCTRQSTDVVAGTAATPAPLADNGGPTLTRALGDGHPAIDAGGLRLDYQVFDSTTLGDWQLNGFTDNNNGEILLAAPAPFFTVGSAFLADPVPVAEDFVAQFDFRIDPLNAPNGADGITFTITDRPNAANGAGGLLGLSDSFNEQTGVRTGAISGVSVEFDTFQNGSGEGANDINGAEVLDAFNHIGINVNGNVSSVANNTAPIPPLDDGSPWTARVEYTASTKTLEVYAAPSASVLPTIPTVSTVLEDDIATLLDNSIGYVGFTGATGTENISGFQQVLNFSFDSGPACEATDQRGVIRPQGSRCDVGAFELEVTAAGTVLSELAVDTGGDTTLESGFAIALDDIPSDRLLAGASAIVGAPLGAIELDAPVDAAPLGAIGLDATPLGAIPLGAIPLGAIPLGAIPLGAINLMDLPIDGGWDAVLAGTSLEGRPPQTVTIEEVFDQVPADQLAEVRLAELDPTASAFGDVSVGSLLLGTVPISDLDTDGQLLAACDAVTGGSCPTDASPLSLELTGSSLTAAPLGAIPLGAIPLGAIPLGAIGTEAAPLGAIPLGAIPLGAIPLGAIGDIQSAPLGAIPLGAIGDLAAAPLGAIPLGAIPLGAIPLGAIPLGAIPLGAIPLGAIDANGDGAVGDVCTFLDADSSAQSCADLGLDDNSTLEDYVDAVGAGDLSATPLGAIPLGAIPLGAIPLGAIDITGIPLGAIQLGAIELAETPLGAIPLGAIPLGAIAFSDVCAAVTDASVTCDGDLLLSDYLAATGASTLGATPLGAITLETLPLGAIPLGAIPLGAISVAGVPLGAIPLGAIDLQTSPLGAIPLGAIPLGAIADSTTGATTLAEAIPLGAILADTPLGAIEPALDADLTLTLDAVLDHLTIAFLGETGGFGDLTLADVLVGILLSSDFPWEDLPLDEIEVRDIACAAVAADVGEGDFLSTACTGDVDTLDVAVSLLLESGDLGGVETRVTIPSDWAYLAESAWLDSGADLFDIEPTVDGSDLVFVLPDTGAPAGSTISLRFAVYAGYQIGSETISATVTGQDSPSLNATSPAIDVVDGLEPSSLGAPTGIDDDTLYIGYIGTTADVDGFEILSAGEGVRTTVFLSNLDQDVDTFIYRPESAPLSGDGTEREIPLDSTPVSDGIDFGGDSPLEPEVQGDSPVAAPTGDVLADSSTNTGTGDEELTILDGPTTESYTIQVAGFQGASSDRPYTLRVKRTAETAQPTTCSPRAYTPLSGSGATIGANTVTLFLTNPARFDDIYGAGSWNTASAQLANLAARTEVGGQIVDIADIPGVAAAFGAWDLDPCDVSAANDIVGAIQVWIQDNAPDSLRHVTIIGADEIVPFARAEDETVVANESTYAGDFGGSPLFSALTTRHYLTDAPYGDFDPIPWVGTKYAYITDLSVGRLVEDATHIAGAIQTYIDNNGVLSPTTAAVASYDFLYDGATLLADRLDEQLGGPVTDRTLMDDPSDPTVTDLTAWTDADLQALINGVPDIISPNSHYDHYRLLPSRENLNETETNLFTIADLPSALDEVIIFTMGCHSGLNVDGSIGTAVEDQDWPEVYSALNAIYIGNTGYGYGDSATVALTESIMANLAGNLDGTLTIGQALTQAKQDQFSKAGLYGVYDLKAIEEATLYGLPFWQISVPGGGPAAPADPAAGPTGTDSLSGLTAASFSIDPSFDLVNSVKGDYFAVNGEVEYLQWRPIQPRTGVDVTKDGLIATGAIFTDLVTRDETITDAAFARPMTVSSTLREPEVETPGIVFPTGFTTVGTGNRVNPNPTGPAVEQVQRLNLIPGQFQGNPTGSGGVQRLFEEIDGTVFYQPLANVGSIDWTRPLINNVDATTSGSQVQFTVDSNDPDSGVSRVTVLYRSGATTWTSVSLTQQGTSDTWIGGGAFGAVTPPLDYFVFSVNGDGVTSVSTFKGGLYETETGTTPIDPVVVTGPEGDVQGVYQGTVTVTGPAGVPVTLDGAPRTFPFDVTGDGPHVVVVDGGPAVNFVIDGNAPTVFVPSGTPQFDLGQLVTTPFGCEDSTTLIRICSADVTKPSGAEVTVDLGGQLPTDEGGTYSVAVTARDEAGNVTVDTFEYVVNADPEITSFAGPETVDQGTEATFTVTFTDAPIDSHRVVFDWGDGRETTIDTGPEAFEATASITYGVPGTYTVEVTVTDNTERSDTASADITVENVAPTVALTGPDEADEGSTRTYSYSFTDPGTDVWTATVSCGSTGSVIAGSEVFNEVTKSGSFICDFADDDPTGTPSDTSTVSVTVTDDAGGTGSDMLTVTVSNVAPTVTGVSAPIDPVNIINQVSVTVDWADPGDDSHTVVIDWGDGDGVNPPTTTTLDNLPEGTRQVITSHTYATAGVYTITATVTDDDTGTGFGVYQFVVVYDPDGGFVTGGGWIDSPAGAYAADPDLTGKASFGFVSKYKKGQSTPDGNTTFQFKTADLKFQSTSYEWLVIAGSRAQYKGTGTINGIGNYGFMLTAIDAELTNSTDADLFRIKIWDKDNNDAVVYDNQVTGDKSDTADPTTAIGGGSIVIHEPSRGGGRN